LLVLLGFTADLVAQQGMPFDRSDAAKDIQLEGLAQLPFIKGGWIMRIEIVVETLLIQRNVDMDIG
jgi:hypothetical protein